MSGILLSLILLQGIPVLQGGTVTGVLRDSKGVPAIGVRMAAVAKGDAIESTAAGSMAGITETDALGRFTLENIPPGRYVIAAGRLDLQTYYPGTQVFADATVLTITRGSTLPNINFVLNDTSAGRSVTFTDTIVLAGFSSSPVATISVSVQVENGGKLPVTANGKEVSLRLSSASNQFSFPIEATAVGVPGPISGDFSVTVDGLPPVYSVKSIAYGATDITKSTFSLSTANFSMPSTSRAIVMNGTTGLFTSVMGITSPAAVPPSALSITLNYALPPTPSGARVAGTIRSVDKPAVYISGVPGIVFSNGTFEFRNVPPGRHVIAAMHPFTPQAALVVVGDQDIDGVTLKRTLAHPDNSVPQAIPPAGSHAPGTVIPLPRILGTAVDETGAAIVDGTVTVENEDYRRMFSLDSAGRFESFSLFPGKYDVSLWVLGHVASKQSVVIEDKDVEITLTLRPEN